MCKLAADFCGSRVCGAYRELAHTTRLRREAPFGGSSLPMFAGQVSKLKMVF